jgi:TP901 family phage tail tape measure protein
MTEKFFINAEIKLVAPSSQNSSQVLTQIKSQLAGIKVPVQLDVKNLPTEVKKVNTQLSSISRQTKRLSDDFEQLGTDAARSLRRFSIFAVTAGSVYKLGSAFESSFKDALEFNKEMVKLQQVTGSSQKQLKEISDEVSRLSIEFGYSSDKIIKVAATLAQADISAKDTKIALQALTKTGVAATFGDINATTEASIAIIKQFGKGAKDLESILGSVNRVAAEFAVESQDIGIAVRRAGSTFKAAGGDFNQFQALFTSIRQTTRASAESIATGLRTIEARLQRPRTQNFLKTLGVDLLNSEKQFVGTYEAVRRLSEALKGLNRTDPRFAQIAEEIGGYRQLDKVIPLIDHFDVAQKAYNAALRGSNSLTQDASIHQKSLAGQLASVNEQFQLLVRNISNDAGFKLLTTGVLGLTTAFIKLVDAVRPFLPILAAFGVAKVATNFSKIGTSFGTELLSGKPKKFADGGKISGPGTGTSDSILARVSNDEYIVSAKGVRSVGVNVLDQINSGKLPKFAKGKRPKPVDAEEAAALRRVKKQLAEEYDDETKARGAAAFKAFQQQMGVGDKPAPQPSKGRQKLVSTDDALARPYAKNLAIEGPNLWRAEAREMKRDSLKYLKITKKEQKVAKLEVGKIEVKDIEHGNQPEPYGSSWMYKGKRKRGEKGYTIGDTSGANIHTGLGAFISKKPPYQSPINLFEHGDSRYFDEFREGRPAFNNLRIPRASNRLVSSIKAAVDIPIQSPSKDNLKLTDKRISTRNVKYYDSPEIIDNRAKVTGSRVRTVYTTARKIHPAGTGIILHPDSSPLPTGSGFSGKPPGRYSVSGSSGDFYEHNRFVHGPPSPEGARWRRGGRPKGISPTILAASVLAISEITGQFSDSKGTLKQFTEVVSSATAKLLALSYSAIAITGIAKSFNFSGKGGILQGLAEAAPISRAQKYKNLMEQRQKLGLDNANLTVMERSRLNAKARFNTGRGSLIGIGVGAAGLVGGTAASYYGDSRIASGDDKTGTLSTIGGGLSGAGAGLAFGAPFGPQAAIAGAVIGGLGGLVMAFSEASQKIKALQLDKALDTFAYKLNSVNSGKLSFDQNKDTLVNYLEKSRGEFNTGTSETRQQVTAGINQNFGAIQELFNKIARESNAFADFDKRSKGTVSFVAQRGNISFSDLKKQIEQTIESSRKEKQSKDKVNAALQIESERLAGFNEFIVGVTEAEHKIRDFENSLDRFIGFINFNVGGFRQSDTSSVFKNAKEGIVGNSFFDVNSQIGSNFGPGGAKLAGESADAARLIKELPDALIKVRGQDALGKEGTFSQRLLNEFKDLSPKLQSSLEGAIEEITHGGNEGPLLDKIKLNVNDLVQDLIKNIGIPIDEISKLEPHIKESVRKTLASLSAYNAAQEKVTEISIKQLQKQHALEDMINEITGNGRPIPLAQLQGRNSAIARQYGGTDNVTQLGKNLSDAQEAIKSFDEQLKSTELNKEKFDKIASQRSLQEKKANDAAKALNYLANESNQLADIQKHIAYEQKQAFYKRTVGETLIFGGRDEKREAAQTIFFTSLAKKFGIENVPTERRRSVAEHLKNSEPEVYDAMLKQGLQNQGLPPELAGQITNGTSNSVDELVEKLSTASKVQEDALGILRDNITAQADLLRAKLEVDNKEWLSNLSQAIQDGIARGEKNKRGVDEGTLNGLKDKLSAIDTLKGKLGINKFDKNAASNFGEFTSLLGQRKDFIENRNKAEEDKNRAIKDYPIKSTLGPNIIGSDGSAVSFTHDENEYVRNRIVSEAEKAEKENKKLLDENTQRFKDTRLPIPNVSQYEKYNKLFQTIGGEDEDTIRQKIDELTKKMNAPTKKANGGLISGFGNGDTVPAMLTPGEFVLNKNAVSRLGLNNLNKINGIQKFAKGGLVARQTLDSIQKEFEEKREAERQQNAKRNAERREDYQSYQSSIGNSYDNYVKRSNSRDDFSQGDRLDKKSRAKLNKELVSAQNFFKRDIKSREKMYLIEDKKNVRENIAKNNISGFNNEISNKEKLKEINENKLSQVNQELRNRRIVGRSAVTDLRGVETGSLTGRLSGLNKANEEQRNIDAAKEQQLSDIGTKTTEFRRGLKGGEEKYSAFQAKKESDKQYRELRALDREAKKEQFQKMNQDAASVAKRKKEAFAQRQENKANGWAENYGISQEDQSLLPNMVSEKQIDSLHEGFTQRRSVEPPPHLKGIFGPKLPTGKKLKEWQAKQDGQATEMVSPPKIKYASDSVKQNNQSIKNKENGVTTSNGSLPIAISQKEIRDLTEAMKQFSIKSEELTKALNNKELNVNIGGKVEVILNGADVISKIQGELKTYAGEEIQKAISKYHDENWVSKGAPARKDK